MAGLLAARQHLLWSFQPTPSALLETTNLMGFSVLFPLSNINSFNKDIKKIKITPVYMPSKFPRVFCKLHHLRGSAHWIFFWGGNHFFAGGRANKGKASEQIQKRAGHFIYSLNLPGYCQPSLLLERWERPINLSICPLFCHNAFPSRQQKKPTQNSVSVTSQVPVLPRQLTQLYNYTSSFDNLHDCFPNSILLR